MGTIPASENIFPLVELAEVAAPATPATGQVRLYAKSDGLLYWKDDAGTEYPAGAAGVAADDVTFDDTGLTNVTGADVQAALEAADAAFAAGGIAATIMAAKGDILGASANDTPAITTVGANGTLLTADSTAGAGLAWAAFGSAAYQRTTGDYTTSSSSFVDVDGTNMALTITTGARRVLISFAGSVQSSVAGDTVALDVLRAGASLTGATFGIVIGTMLTTAARNINVSFTYLTDVLTAGSHTFKVQWKRASGSGTLTLLGNTSTGACRFSVQEMP